MIRGLEAVKEEKKGIEQLEEKLNGIPALLFTKENPFKLFSLIKKNKSKAAAKPGQLAPNDLTIPAGPTSFTPGPIISELGALGLKTKVNDGKIDILEDHVIVKEGEEITQEVASLLQKMNIEPMEIGLDLVCVFENGELFGKDVLSIDEDEYAANFANAQKWAFNLAVEAGIFTTETTELLIQKAFKETKAVSLEAGILNDATKDELLSKAAAQGEALSGELDLDKKVEEMKSKESENKEESKPEEDKKEEAPQEEKKEEVKEESKEVESNNNKNTENEKKEESKENEVKKEKTNNPTEDTTKE